MFDPRPNYGGGNEGNGKLLRNIPCTHCCTQCPQTCNRPPLTHTSARDSWTLMDKSRSVSCGVTAPFSWVLVCTRFCLCPPRVCFPVLCKFWLLSGGVNGDLFKRGFMPYQGLLHPKPLPRWQATADPYLHRRHSTQFCLSLCRVSGSWCTQSLFEPSRHLWWIWGLILNVISPHVSLSELQEMVMGREAWCAMIHGVTKSRTRMSD